MIEFSSQIMYLKIHIFLLYAKLLADFKRNKNIFQFFVSVRRTIQISLLI